MMRASERGHVMIELAVCAAVMVSFLAGTVQFGYTFYIYNQLVTAVGNGGRYAAQRTFRAATQQDTERGNAAIRNMVVYGDPQPVTGAAPVVPNLKPEQVEVRWVAAGQGAPKAVDVSIHGYTVDAVFHAFTFEGRPSVEFPYVGRYAPAESEP
jgi:Flp pilus assembly protein TadG